VPDGYFVLRSRTYGNLLFFRGFVVGGDLRPAVENAKRTSASTRWPRGGPARDDVRRHLRRGVQHHPRQRRLVLRRGRARRAGGAARGHDPETRGLLAAIGIRKDRPFAPDERMRRILAEAAAVGNATARALAFSTRDPDAYYYPDSAWKMLWIGNDYRFSPGGVLDLDARTMYFYVGIGISPVDGQKMVGARLAVRHGRARRRRPLPRRRKPTGCTCRRTSR
jgi:hypothetical protein